MFISIGINNLSHTFHLIVLNVDPRFTANEFLMKLTINLNDETPFLKYFVSGTCNEWFETVMSGSLIIIGVDKITDEQISYSGKPLGV